MMLKRGLAAIAALFGGYRSLSIALFIALAAAAWLNAQGLAPCDDAYITFRHVRHLIEHGRPAWNLTGDPVLGSTSSAYLFALGAYTWIIPTSAIDSAALQVNTGLHFLLVLLAFLVIRDLTGSAFWSISGAALIGFNSVNVQTFSQGFESPMLIAAVLGALYAARIGRHTTAATLASIAPLIRPEGILCWLLVLGVVAARRDFRCRLIPAFVAIPAVWVLFAVLYYGSPIPQSVRAIARFPMMHFPYAAEPVSLLDRIPRIPSALAELWSTKAGPLLISGTVELESALPFAAARYAVLAIGGLAAIIAYSRRRDARLIYMLFGPAFLLLFSWLGHTKPWYFPPLVTFGIVTVVAGWSSLGATLRQTRSMTDNPDKGLQSISFAVLRTGLALSAIFALLTANIYRRNIGQPEFTGRAAFVPEHPSGRLWDIWEAGRYRQYRLAAEWLNDRVSPGQTAMISEVGVFGFYFRGEVIDVMGLCSPEALTFYPPPPDDVYDSAGSVYSNAGTLTPSAMIAALRPDYVVNSRAYIANLLRPYHPFLEIYAPMVELGKVWGEPLMIYERRSSVGQPP